MTIFGKLSPDHTLSFLGPLLTTLRKKKGREFFSQRPKNKRNGGVS